MAYNVFQHSSAGESAFYLMFGHDPFMPTAFKLLFSKLWYMGDKKCKIHLDAMWEIYMMAALNLKWHEKKAHLQDHSETNFMIGDPVLLRNHTPPKKNIDSKYKTSFQICKKFSDKAFEVQDTLGKVKWVSIQDLQLLHPTEHVLNNLLDINSFWCTMKYINHPNFMPDLSTTITEKTSHTS